MSAPQRYDLVAGQMVKKPFGQYVEYVEAPEPMPPSHKGVTYREGKWDDGIWSLGNVHKALAKMFDHPTEEDYHALLALKEAAEKVVTAQYVNHVRQTPRRRRDMSEELRKVKQLSSCAISGSEHSGPHWSLYALCYDGTIWDWDWRSQTWSKLPPIPQDPIPTEPTR